MTASLFSSQSKVPSWSWRTVGAWLLCFTVRAQATSRWSSSCWITTLMPTSSEFVHSSKMRCLPHRFNAFSFTHRVPGSGFTPLMEAAASGHEIIVQNLLDHVSWWPRQICSLPSSTTFSHNWWLVMVSHKERSHCAAHTGACFAWIVSRKWKLTIATLKERLPGRSPWCTATPRLSALSIHVPPGSNQAAVSKV